MKPMGEQENQKPRQKRNARNVRGRYPLSETSQTSIKIIRKDPLLSFLLDESPKPPPPARGNGAAVSETVVKVEKAVGSLGQLESEVISALFPADGSDPASFEAIATQLGMTPDEVKGIADNALRGLRGTPGSSRMSKAWN